MKLAYDPVERHKNIERAVIQERIGGDLRSITGFAMTGRTAG